MIETSVLTDRLKSFEYYVSKLPMYLQNSYGFIEHFRIFYDVLINNYDSTASVVNVIDTLFNLLNIFDLNCSQYHSSSYAQNQHYLNFLNSLEDSNQGTASDILDKLGNLFGLKRQFSLYVDGSNKELSLTNEDFLLLIKCTIVKNYFDGSYAELNEYYALAGLPVFTLTIQPATCNMYLIELDDSSFTFSDNVKYMFRTGMLTVESMGISYIYTVQGVQNLAIFDSLMQNNSFDYGVFVI